MLEVMVGKTFLFCIVVSTIPSWMVSWNTHAKNKIVFTSSKKICPRIGNILSHTGTWPHCCSIRTVLCFVFLTWKSRIWSCWSNSFQTEFYKFLGRPAWLCTNITFKSYWKCISGSYQLSNNPFILRNLRSVSFFFFWISQPLLILSYFHELSIIAFHFKKSLSAGS